MGALDTCCPPLPPPFFFRPIFSLYIYNRREYQPIIPTWTRSRNPKRWTFCCLLQGGACVCMRAHAVFVLNAVTFGEPARTMRAGERAAQ
jgi:hypothetical protein